MYAWTSILWEKSPQCPLAFGGGWLVPFGGPVHSLREPGIVWVSVQLRVESVVINLVAAILVSYTPLILSSSKPIIQKPEKKKTRQSKFINHSILKKNGFNLVNATMQ